MKNNKFPLTLLVFLLPFLSMASPIVVWNPYTLGETTLWNGGEGYALLISQDDVIGGGGLYLLTEFRTREITVDWDQKLELYDPGGMAGWIYIIVEAQEGALIDYTSTRDASTCFDNNGWGGGVSIPSVLTYGESFYFGVQFMGQPVGRDALFGWVELLWDDNGLQLVNGAMEITGQGIYCGEFRAVPEPGTVGLLLAGGAGLLGMRRRRRNENHKAKS